jgi:hypothetical protein
MMPMTRENTLLKAAFVQGESHVGTTVVESKHLSLVQAKQQRTILASQCHHSPFLQFGEGRYPKEITELTDSGLHIKKRINRPEL